ncbi:outer membrane beta-barrel protein [Pontibacterium sp. N1Y112]|uniref:Outer membrane beta-barrel protein n=1 Tax=Pontibacterium sinense TaxID=2781979 RepID=A0A8J7FRL9_9GAMM|nr:OmpW family outer membrane protein [Pontibacterium sinense]MBE9396105.1 outer membrane beta-barrel protein [Pontibacterium sinense]
MKKTAVSTLIGAVVLAASSAASAYEAGDIIVRAGIASVQPNETMEAGSTLDTLNGGLGNNEQLGITASYMLTDKLGLELLAATPFKHDITSNGAKIGETKHLPPTLSLQYYPMDNQSAVQPYVGVGVNYTTFFSEESTLGNLKLDDSWGLAAQAGVDYAVSDNVVLNAAVWYIDIDSDASLNGADIGTVALDPWVYMVGVGYKY